MHHNPRTRTPSVDATETALMDTEWYMLKIFLDII